MTYKVEEHKIIKVQRGLRRTLVQTHAQHWVSDKIKLGCLAFYQIWIGFSGRRLRNLYVFQCLTVLMLKESLLFSLEKRSCLEAL